MVFAWLGDQKDVSTGWYKNTYKISSENFKYDGIYTISISSQDAAGNYSQSIIYDELDIRFAVDTTKPDVVSIVGLESNLYNAQKIDIKYMVFDSVAIKEVRIYLNGELEQTVKEFNDQTTYEGTLTINEGVDQTIRFEVEDFAGNVIDTDNEEDLKSGKVAKFNSKVTVSTNIFIQWYSNRVLFICSIVAVVLVGCGIVYMVVRRKKQK